MIDIYSVKDEDIRKTIAPIDIDLLREKFSNPDIVFLIDYDNSLFKDKKFLTYVGNLQIDCDLSITDATSKEERFTLLKEYIETRTIAPIPVLSNAFASVLCMSKGIDTYNKCFDKPYLSTEEIAEFIEQNHHLVHKHRVLMDSMVVFAMYTSLAYVEAFGDPKYTVNNIDNANEFGSNFVHLFSNTLFMEIFYSVPGVEFHYFTKQFEEFMYGSKCLYDYFVVSGNPLVAAFDYIGTSDYTLEDADKDLIEAQRVILEKIENE